ncbi:hypothetical protein O0I10_003032 [Lichtheimia ornata]|uniref:Uncharacterized protein n=1 Tax=Lichtheimia ornata TaxID=688661 RepID=A0AAD7Y2L7_9FUNG|nr:uncharacterized protein O0I10_003032 [Lichtheimia ornata]KAJ8661282.1 hypothetical protein O0I10_003032 [Lichtheimia ornata]
MTSSFEVQQFLWDDMLTLLASSSWSDTPESRLPTPTTSCVPVIGTKRKTSNARMGYCEHPKHVLYRQEPFTLGATPRRGRPPKGTKASDLVCPPLTVRPLPRRLEMVVGKKNICVCLTCLKRTDLDTEYIVHPAYIGPQQKKL